MVRATVLHPGAEKKASIQLPGTAQSTQPWPLALVWMTTWLVPPTPFVMVTVTDELASAPDMQTEAPLPAINGFGLTVSVAILADNLPESLQSNSGFVGERVICSACNGAQSTSSKASLNRQAQEDEPAPLFIGADVKQRFDPIWDRVGF